MSIDLPAAVAFLATHGRVLDRRRLELLVHGGDPTAVLAALDGYRNLDGGYGWGPEPDLRSPESQPAGAIHACATCWRARSTPPLWQRGWRAWAGTAGLTASREEVPWAVRRLFEALARDRPLIVVVDDLHWASLLCSISLSTKPASLGMPRS
jgi:hypothetical protein